MHYRTTNIKRSFISYVNLYLKEEVLKFACKYYFAYASCPVNWADLRDIIHCDARPQIRLVETIYIAL